MRAVSGRAFCACLAALSAPCVHAHHVAGLVTPKTFGAGLLSGLGHPVIGLGSLAFLLAIGLWCAQTRQPERRPTGLTSATLALPALLAGTAAGGLLEAAGLVLPVDDLLVAISVIAGGMLLWVSRRSASPLEPLSPLSPLSPGSILPIAVAIGMAAVAHGMVAAEGSAGATGGPLLAYWIGILLMQIALWFAAFRLAAALMASRPLVAKWAGAIGAVAVMLAGATLIVYPGATLSA